MDGKIFEVDGIFFQRDGNILVMTYSVEGVLHTFRIQERNAIKMKQALNKLYPSN